MKTVLDCNIVRDMLPLYLEGLTSEESNTAVYQHLENCEECKEYFEKIKMPITFPAVPKKDIDYMKKVKRSLKQKTRILIGIIILSFTLILVVFLRIFIIGSSIALEETLMDYEWNYDTNTKICSIRGKIGHAQDSIRVNVYKDRQSGTIMVKPYRILPSIFYPSNEFSVKIPWDEYTNIVWQGTNDQWPLLGAQDLNLVMTKFKDGDYQHLIDKFDVDGYNLIKDLYNNAEEVLGTELDSFDEEKYDEYLIIVLTSTKGTHISGQLSDSKLETEILDERIFLYSENEQYYFHKKGEHLKKISAEDIEKIQSYVKENEF